MGKRRGGLDNLAGHEWTRAHSAEDLLTALVQFSDGRGRYQYSPRLIRSRLFWGQDDLSALQVTRWLGELRDRGRIEILMDGENCYDPEPIPVVHLTNRQQYDRYKPRPAIPDELRRRVYLRDGSVCLACGATDGLTLDHIHPYSLGGEDTFENLQTLCGRCNSSKGARVA